MSDGLAKACGLGKMYSVKENISHFIKKEILSAPVLAYYNPKKQSMLQTDASIKGLGACALQE